MQAHDDLSTYLAEIIVGLFDAAQLRGLQGPLEPFVANGARTYSEARELQTVCHVLPRRLCHLTSSMLPHVTVLTSVPIDKAITTTRDCS